MKIPKSSIKFLTNLHKLISEEEKKYDKSVDWIEKNGKKGFIILNLREFHERCILNLVTISYNHKSLFRQLHNYGFKQIKGFWYHNKNLFFKDSNNFKNIKRSYWKKIKKENKIIQTSANCLSEKKKGVKRKTDSNKNSKSKKVKKEDKIVQTESFYNYDKRDNCIIMKLTQDFLVGEEFDRLDFDFIEEDFSSCFEFLSDLY